MSIKKNDRSCGGLSQAMLWHDIAANDRFIFLYFFGILLMLFCVSGFTGFYKNIF